jgi:hypothetical protein
MKKPGHVGRPALSTKSKPFLLRLHPPVLDALESEADQAAKRGPRPSTVTLIRFFLTEALKGRGHKLD